MAEEILWNVDSNSQEISCAAVDSGIKLLPTELVQTILSHVTDISSLLGLAQSCNLFHHAFLDNRDSILHDVLQKEITANVLPEALLTFASACLSDDNDSKAKPSVRHKELGYLLNLPQFVEIPQAPLSIPDALAISELHDDVNYFSYGFAPNLTANSFTGTTSKDQIVLRPNEMDRIYRAFYRYELFCNIFRDECCKNQRQTSTILEQLFILGEQTIRVNPRLPFLSIVYR